MTGSFNVLLFSETLNITVVIFETSRMLFVVVFCEFDINFLLIYTVK